MLKFNRLPIVRKVNRRDFKQYIACKLAIYICFWFFNLLVDPRIAFFLYTRYEKISIFTNIEKAEQVQWELNQVIIAVSTLLGFYLPLVISEIADKVLSLYISRLETTVLRYTTHYCVITCLT